VSIRAKRRELSRLAEQIDGGETLNYDQLRWLSAVLARIGNGESADSVLGLVARRGERRRSEEAKEVLDFILFYVAGQIDQGMAVDKAFEEGVRLHRMWLGLDPHDPDDRYGIDYLRRMANKYPEKLRSVRKDGDEDFAL
jgi:hypothetical protein